MWRCQLWLCVLLPRSKDRPVATGLLPSSCHPDLHLLPLVGGTGAILHAAAAAAAGSAARLQPGHGGIVQLHVLRGEQSGDAPLSTWGEFEFHSPQVPAFADGFC